MYISRKVFFWIRYVINYLVYVYLIFLLIKSRERLNSNKMFGIAAFFLLPVIGSILQLVYIELFFTWTMLALCVVVVYIFLETTSGNHDRLTLLYSRCALEDYIKSLIEKKKSFCALMLDLDRFKDINDKYGHRAGDEVLIAFGKTLVRCEPRDKFVSRYGGDEFFVVFPENDCDALEEFTKAIFAEFKSDPVIAFYPFISFSYGMVQVEDEMTVDEFFGLADRKMYDNKETKKIQ